MPTLLSIFFIRKPKESTPFALNQFYELHTIEREFHPAQNQVSGSQFLRPPPKCQHNKQHSLTTQQLTSQVIP